MGRLQKRKKKSEYRKLYSLGADNRSRTCMNESSYGPEPYASANSAISAKYSPRKRRKWWMGMDSNHRSQRRQIYSLFPLATREPIHFQKTCTLWSWWGESNPQPADYKSAALPIELHQHLYKWCLRVESNHRHRDFQSLALPTELPRHVYRFWWAFTDSNRGPIGYEPTALTN